MLHIILEMNDVFWKAKGCYWMNEWSVLRENLYILNAVHIVVSFPEEVKRVGEKWICWKHVIDWAWQGKIENTLRHTGVKYEVEHQNTSVYLQGPWIVRHRESRKQKRDSIVLTGYCIHKLTHPLYIKSSSASLTWPSPWASGTYSHANQFQLFLVIHL